MKITTNVNIRVFKILISLIILLILFYLFNNLISSSESIIEFIKGFNDFLQPEPSYVSALDSFLGLVPSIYFLSLLLCGLTVIFLKLVFRTHDIFQVYLPRVVIITIIIFFFIYLKSFYDNKKMYERYHKVEQTGNVSGNGGSIAL